MVHGTFVLSAYSKHDTEVARRIEYRQTNTRYLVVLIAILVVFGCEYCFDNASALQIPIEDNLAADNMDITEFEFNLLYALYAFPNVIIPLLGGILIDKIGARIVLIISAMFCVLGHLIFGFGGYRNVFGIMLVGRAVFGIGGEVLHAAQNTLISTWFKPSQLSMVLGICLSFPKMGSSLNSFITPRIADHFDTDKANHLNVAIPIFVGAILMSISLILSIVLAYIDRKNEKSEQIVHQTRILTSQQSIRRRTSFKNKKSSKANVEVKIVESSVIDNNPREEIDATSHLNFKEVCKLPLTFWMIILICMLSESLFIPFLDNGNAYYVDIFNIQPTDAGIYLILPYCVSSVFVIILGLVVDKVQKRSYLLIASCAFYTITYIFMVFVESTPSLNEAQFVRWMPSFLLGICIAIFCTIIVPTVPMLVPPKLLGTGFGMMEMLQNLALGVFPLVGGALRQSQEDISHAQGFHLQTLFFFLISCLCVGAGIILKGIDLTTGDKLDVKDFRRQYLRNVLGEREQ